MGARMKFSNDTPRLSFFPILFFILNMSFDFRFSFCAFLFAYSPLTVFSSASPPPLRTFGVFGIVEEYRRYSRAREVSGWEFEDA